jgi:hypothetical protein
VHDRVARELGHRGDELGLVDQPEPLPLRELADVVPSPDDVFVAAEPQLIRR